MAAPKNVAQAAPEAQALSKLQQHISAELGPLLAGLDRLVTLLRVYPLGHPLVDQFATQLSQRFNDLIERVGPLEIVVSAEALSTTWGDVLLDARRSERGHFLWFQASSEGLAGFILTPLDSDVLQRFLQIINRCDLRQLPPDDDIITLAWDAQLSSIEIIGADSMSERSTSSFGALSEREATDALLDASINPGSGAAQRLVTPRAQLAQLDIFTQHNVSAALGSPTLSSSPISAEDLSHALRIDPSWFARIHDEWQHGADLEYRLVEALISILRTSPGSPQASLAYETILRLTIQLFEDQSWSALSSLLLLLRARQADLPPDTTPLTQIIAFISEPIRLETLIFQVQRARADREQLSELLVILDPALLQRQLLRALADERRDLLASALLVDLLLHVTTDASASALRDEALLSSPRYLERMIDGLAGKPIKHPRELAAIYCAALQSPLVDLRAGALHAYDPRWGSQHILETFVKPLTNDRDEQVRKLAMELLRRERPQVFLDLLQSLVEEGQLVDRSASELRFMLRQYMQHYPGGEAKLRALLHTSGWFNTARRELARCVATVLIELGDAETITLISAQANNLWTYPKLRHEYRRLLERVKAEGSPLPPGEAGS